MTRGLTTPGVSCSTLEMKRCLPNSHRWRALESIANRYKCRLCGANGYQSGSKMIIRRSHQENP